MKPSLVLRRLTLLATALVATSAPISDAAACGGFFCSATQPVNQAAERIIFADNADGTVTAVIQIMYDGPSENFSWLLPISTVPQGDEIAVASDVAFQRLQAATNPQYNLTTRVEGTCMQTDGGPFGTAGATGSAPNAGGSGGASSGGGVTVEGKGIVGSFEWTVISVDQSLPDLADAAVNWLENNGYDVSEGARGLIRPYLMDGLYLLALKLTKGATSGSIRPIVLTYGADEPMIPIKLTAVAANENMGVMTWLLQESRGVPQNYLSLELNEARINWFNGAQNYNDVVTAAADEATGQGFVTEFAGQTTRLDNVVWSTFDDQNWQAFTSGNFRVPADMFTFAVNNWSGWDGFWDAIRETVTLSNGLTVEDLRLCAQCYQDQLQFSPAALVTAIEASVIQPVRDVQALIDRNGYVTRLYTTMSAAEMTVDPLFTFNPDLPDVDNVHTAERVIECNPNVSFFEAPWRIELPQGGVIRGSGTPNPGAPWPVGGNQPSNFRITRLSDTGDGAVVEDNSATIQEALDDYNSSLGGSPGAGGSNDVAGRAGMPGVGGRNAAGSGNGNEATDSGDSGGCATSPRRAASGVWVVAALSALALLKRRRRSAQ